MVAAIAAFGDRGASEFPAPDDEGFVEQAALFEIADQGGGRFVHIGAAFVRFLVDVFVIVPGLAGAVVNLHVADAALDQTAGHQAAMGVRGVAVIVADGSGFFAGYRRRRMRFELHAVGGFHGLDAAFEVRDRCRSTAS